LLEHLDDPRGILAVLREYLVPRGILVLETPDCSGVKTIASHSDYLKIQPLDHINGFTPATLRGIAGRLGFKPIKVPASHVIRDPMRVAKTDAKRVLHFALSESTRHYFTALMMIFDRNAY
jgi:hypothetical protein